MNEQEVIYDAFISYSRRDSDLAAWLKNKLERYNIPKGLAIEKERINVFRDFQDLVGTELSTSLEKSIRQSEHLLLLCSPASRASKWVNEEIEYFSEQHGTGKVIPVIVDGRPNNEVSPDDAVQDQAFPDALLKCLNEPLAADFRALPSVGYFAKQEKRREALFQVLATLLNVEKDTLLRRHLQRKRRLQSVAIAVLLALTVSFAWIANLANNNAKEATRQKEIAEQERDIANARRLASDALLKDDGTAFGLHLSTLLGIESLNRYPTPQGIEAVEYNLRRLPKPVSSYSVGQGAAIALSPDGTWLAAATSGAENQVQVWNLSDSTFEWSVTRAEQSYDIAINNSAQKVAIHGSGQDRKIRILDIPSKQALDSFPAASGPLAFDSEGRLLAYTNPDRFIEVRDLEQQKTVAVLEPSFRANDLKFSADGKVLIILLYRDNVEMWDIAERTLIQPISSIAEINETEDAFIADQRAGSITGDGKFVITGDGAGNVKLWDTGTNKELFRALHGARHIQSSLISANGSSIAAVSFRGVLQTWTLGKSNLLLAKDGEPLASFPHVIGNDLTHAAFNDGERIIVSDLQQEKEIGQIPSRHPLGRMSDISIDGKWLALSDGYGVLELWNTQTGERASQISTPAEDFGGLIHRVQVTAAGNRVALGGEFGIVKVLDTHTGETLLDAKGSGGSATSRATAIYSLSQKGGHLLIIDESGFVDIWEISSQSVVGRLDLGSRGLACSFDNEDKYFATLSVDRTVRIWNISTHKEVARIKVDKDQQLLGFSADNKVVLLDENGRLHFHLWGQADLITEACSRLRINMSEAKWHQFVGDEPYQIICPNLSVPDATARAQGKPQKK